MATMLRIANIIVALLAVIAAPALASSTTTKLSANSRLEFFALNAGHQPGDSLVSSETLLSSSDPLRLTTSVCSVAPNNVPPSTGPVNTPELQRYLNESGGRWGGTATRQLNDKIATDLKNQGFQITGGAGRRPEEWFPGPGGGTKGGTFVDITAKKGTETVRVQTVSTLADGVTLTANEAAAAARIRAKFPGEQLILVSKQTGQIIP
jgi:filamentous hemagglutinin